MLGSAAGNSKGAQPRNRVFLRPTGLAASRSSALADISILFLSLLWLGFRTSQKQLQSLSCSQSSADTQQFVLGVFAQPSFPPELRGSGPAWIPPQAHVLAQNWEITTLDLILPPPHVVPTSICPGRSWQGPQTTEAKLSGQKEGLNFTHCCKTCAAVSQEHYWCSFSLNSSSLCVGYFLLQFSA